MIIYIIIGAAKDSSDTSSDWYRRSDLRGGCGAAVHEVGAAALRNTVRAVRVAHGAVRGGVRLPTAACVCRPPVRDTVTSAGLLLSARVAVHVLGTDVAVSGSASGGIHVLDKGVSVVAAVVLLVVVQDRYRRPVVQVDESRLGVARDGAERQLCIGATI